MDIKCPACQSGYRIPKEKIPTDKEMFAFPCPNCSHPLTVNLKSEDPSSHLAEMETVAEGPIGASDDLDEDFVQSYDATDKPFDFVKKGERTALVCESNPDLYQHIRPALEALNYSCSDAESTLAALKQMRYHNFDLVVLNELFDGKTPEDNPLRTYLSRLPMAVRRDIYVVLLTKRFRTMDNMAAFNLSVNQIIHEKHVDKMEQIVRRGLADHEAFYKVYRQARETAGETERVLDRDF